jgi:CheY-like chemotaxis protein/HPt (histidine-containing phosphotransfer) domain-containing protein
MLLNDAQQKERVLNHINIIEKEINALKSLLSLEPTCAAAASLNPPAEFNGQLILVVDDQSMNLDLIAALLEDCNLKVICTSCAEQALKFMQDVLPDLILMDIQMPQMDGYTATQKIRSLYGPNGPIILAMTANDTDADKQKSLVAGMQGHIVKPIDADYLLTQLNHWLHKGTSTDSNSRPVTPVIAAKVPTNSEPPTHTGLPGIDVPAAMARLRGNRELLDEVLVSFAAKAALIVPELHQAKRDNDIEQAMRLLHRLKGTSANLSAYKIAPLAGKLESLCKQGNLPPDDELINLDAFINEVIVSAQGLQKCPLPAAAQNHDLDESQLKQHLTDIQTHLNTDLAQAEDAVEALNRLCTNTGCAEAANQLKTLFYQFNLRAVNDLIAKGFERH